jgi:hypothetical protein
MEITVVPFTPSVTTVNPAKSAALELESIIAAHVKVGWEFVSLENLQTVVNNPGCFGFGAKSEMQTIQLIIFRAVKKANID